MPCRVVPTPEGSRFLPAVRTRPSHWVSSTTCVHRMSEGHFYCRLLRHCVCCLSGRSLCHQRQRPLCRLQQWETPSRAGLEMVFFMCWVQYAYVRTMYYMYRTAFRAIHSSRHQDPRCRFARQLFRPQCGVHGDVHRVVARPLWRKKNKKKSTKRSRRRRSRAPASSLHRISSPRDTTRLMPIASTSLYWIRSFQILIFSFSFRAFFGLPSKQVQYPPEYLEFKFTKQNPLSLHGLPIRAQC